MKPSFSLPCREVVAVMSERALSIEHATRLHQKLAPFLRLVPVDGPGYPERQAGEEFVSLAVREQNWPLAYREQQPPAPPILATWNPNHPGNPPTFQQFVKLYRIKLTA